MSLDYDESMVATAAYFSNSVLDIVRSDDLIIDKDLSDIKLESS